jgi:hypothetical protein
MGNPKELIILHPAGEDELSSPAGCPLLLENRFYFRLFPQPV